MYNPQAHTVSNKSYGLAQPGPTDGRSYYRDPVLHIKRPYQSKAEAIAELQNPTVPLSQYRDGRYSIYVNEGGTLNANGIFTGGDIVEYWFKDGFEDTDLVPKLGVVAVGGSFAFENCITEYGGLVRLGGVASRDTNIDMNGFALNISYPGVNNIGGQFYMSPDESYFGHHAVNSQVYVRQEAGQIEMGVNDYTDDSLVALVLDKTGLTMRQATALVNESVLFVSADGTLINLAKFLNPTGTKVLTTDTDGNLLLVEGGGGGGTTSRFGAATEDVSASTDRSFDLVNHHLLLKSGSETVFDIKGSSTHTSIGEPTMTFGYQNTFVVKDAAVDGQSASATIMANPVFGADRAFIAMKADYGGRLTIGWQSLPNYSELRQVGVFLTMNTSGLLNIFDGHGSIITTSNDAMYITSVNGIKLVCTNSNQVEFDLGAVSIPITTYLDYSYANYIENVMKYNSTRHRFQFGMKFGNTDGRGAFGFVPLEGLTYFYTDGAIQNNYYTTEFATPTISIDRDSCTNYMTVHVDRDCSFAVTNLRPGTEFRIEFVGITGSGINTISFPGGWIWVTVMPTNVNAGDKAILTLTVFDAANIYARWEPLNTELTLVSGASIPWNYSASSEAKLLLAHNGTLVISGLPSSGVVYGTVKVTQDGTGSRTLALPAGSTVIGGGGGVVALTAAAGGVDILSFRYDGTSFFWTKGLNYT